MEDSLKELGSKLVKDSKANEEFSAQRGLIKELFPYIYESSKRMSSRAISRWLKSNGTKLSAATIAKALRNPELYWEEIINEIKPAVELIAVQHGELPCTILKSDELFSHLEKQLPRREDSEHPSNEREASHTWQELVHEYLDACSILEKKWFSMSPVVREACLSKANFDDDDGPENPYN